MEFYMGIELAIQFHGRVYTTPDYCSLLSAMGIFLKAGSPAGSCGGAPDAQDGLPLASMAKHPLTPRTTSAMSTHEALGSPLLHAIGFPALGQHHAADNRLPPQGDVIVRPVPVEVAAQAAHFVLQPLADADFEDVEAVVQDLDIRAGVDDQEALHAVDFGRQPGDEGDGHLGAVHLLKGGR